MKKYPRALQKSVTRLISLIIAFMIIVASIPAGLAMAITDEQEEKINALKTAWENLRVTKTELFATPYGDCRRTTADATDLTDEEKTAFGDYYYYNNTTTQYTYRAPDGTNNFVDYSSKENIKYTFSYKTIFGTSTKKNFQVNINYSTSGWSGPYLSVGNKLTTHTIDKTEKIKGIQIKNPNGHTVYMGCIYATYDEAIALPENCDSFTVAEWITAAKSVDLTGCANATEFNNAIDALSETVDEAAVLNNFLTAWENLRVEEKEPFAVPKADCRLTTEASDLNDEEKVAFGEYYYYNTDGVLRGYVCPDGQTAFADYSEKENVRYKFSYKMLLGTSDTNNFQVTVQNTAGEYFTDYLSTANALTERTIDAAGKGITSVKQIQIKNPAKNTVYMGCIYAYYYEPVDFPLYSDSFTVYDWITAAENLDLTNCVDTTEFEEALTALREFTAEGRAFNKLVDAWSNLKVNKTELFATPYGACRLTTADSTDLTDEEKDAFGEYYYYNNTNTQYTYRAPDGTTNYADYSSKENVKYTFSYKMIFGASATKNYVVNFKKDSTNWVPFYIATGNKLTTYTIDAAEKELLSVKGLQIKNQNAHTVYMGCIYVTYDAPLDMPGNIGLMSLRELVKAAKGLDLSVFAEDVANAFTTEIEAAEKAIESIVIDEDRTEKLKEHLISAWRKLIYYDKELWAVPESKYQKATTEAAAEQSGLSSEDLGKYYANVSFSDLAKGLLYFNAPDGSNDFDSISDAIGLTVSYSFKDDNGNVVTGGGGKVELQFNSKDTTYPASPKHTATINSTDEKFAKYFDGTEAVKNVKVFKNKSSEYKNIAIGSIYKVIVKNEELPYGYENMELPVLLKYASELDMEKYDADAADNFIKAVNDVSAAANLMVVLKSENLIAVADSLGIDYSNEFTVEELVSAAMTEDLSNISDKQSFLTALWELRLYTCDGAAIHNLKAVWNRINNSLPENYAQLSVKQWIELAEKLDTSSNSALQEKFEYELRQLKYYFTGIPEISGLKKYVEIASTMDSNNFVKSTWNSFNKILALAKEIIKSPSAYTQTKADKTLEELLSAWGNLKYYERTLYVDFTDYYKVDPDIKLVFNPKDSRNTYTELITDIKLENGVDRAIKVVNTSKEDGGVVYRGKELMSVNGYAALEFYIKLEDFDMPNGNASFTLQLMNKGGTEWFDYYFSITANKAEEGWLHFVVPISSFIDYANGKRQEGIYMNENGFIVNRVKIVLREGSGTYSFSNIVALKECSAVSGVAPEISPISIYREPEVVKVPPKNPFSGIDRGDPWGDEYRSTLKKDVIENEPSIKNENNNSNSYVYVIIVASLVLAGLIAGFVIFILKKRKKPQADKES